VIETVAVLLVVGLAAAALLRRAWRTVAASKDGACGCGPKPGCPAARSLVGRLPGARARR
jgi:hypothetical protein